MAKNANGGGTRIQSVSRASRLLLLVASLPEQERSAARLALALGTSLPTTYHLLNTLVESQLLARGENKRYQLGVGVGLLSAAYEQQTQLPLQVLVPLRRLSTETGESVYLSAWRHGELQVLARVEGTHAVRVADLQPGFRGAAHARASGKVLLAFTSDSIRDDYVESHPLQALTESTITNPLRFAEELATVRSRGYATEEEEFIGDVGCVSVPILSGETLMGAYTISAPIERYRALRDDYVDQLKHAALAAVAVDVVPPQANRALAV
ncbi:MAG TPA: IclR family transcriptional regulator [Galbitalea sp.]|jgi:DNA-binding IclR family transcriptional regulator